MAHTGNFGRWMIILPLAAGLLGLIFLGCEDPGSYGQVELLTFGHVVVHQSAVEPPMDNPRDAIWNDAPTSAIFASDSAFAEDSSAVDSLPIYIKVIKTSEYLYLRVRWAENAVISSTYRTYSVWPNAMVYNVSVSNDTDTTLYWTREGKKVIYTDTAHVDSVIYWHDQDRFAVIWNTGDNGGEGADCRTMCHAVADTSLTGDRMYTTGGGHADVWHWQAGTTDPVYLAEDEYWGPEGRTVDAFAQPIFDANYDSVLFVPLSMNQDSTQRLKPFLHLDDAIPFDSTYSWKNLDSIPGYIVNDNASGSIADVSAYSSFSRSDGSWMVVMRRLLNTGNPDDFNFASIQPGDSVMVTMAFMDNSPAVHHGSRPFYIIFPQ
jgi:hypothetical protein